MVWGHGIHGPCSPTRDEGHEQSISEYAEVMIVCLVIEPAEACPIRARHGLQSDCRTIGENDPVPGHQNAGLAVDDPGVIDPVEFRSLGDEQVVTIGRVENVLAHLGR